MNRLLPKGEKRILDSEEIKRKLENYLTEVAALYNFSDKKLSEKTPFYIR